MHKYDLRYIKQRKIEVGGKEDTKRKTQKLIPVTIEASHPKLNKTQSTSNIISIIETYTESIYIHRERCSFKEMNVNEEMYKNKENYSS